MLGPSVGRVRGRAFLSADAGDFAASQDAPDKTASGRIRLKGRPCLSRALMCLVGEVGVAGLGPSEEVSLTRAPECPNSPRCTCAVGYTILSARCQSCGAIGSMGAEARP
eukprot:5206066-Pyramimonas_sp.AAC.1